MPSNIFAEIPALLPTEQFTTLLQSPGVKLERIVSKGHITPIGEWYDQAWDEWVLLLQGKAIVLFAAGNSLTLMSGDYLMIPAHQRHRLSYTDLDIETIWLALHIDPAEKYPA